jgi:hypothetical protein
VPISRNRTGDTFFFSVVNVILRSTPEPAFDDEWFED